MKNRTSNRNYYHIPVDKLGFVLSKLELYGWEFCSSIGIREPIENHYKAVTSRDWGSHNPVFVLKEHNDYRDLYITSDLVIKDNDETTIIKSYEDFKQDYLKRF